MQEAIAGVEQAVDEFIAEREAADEDVPVPLTERAIQRQVRRQDVAGAACASGRSDRLPTGLFDL